MDDGSDNYYPLTVSGLVPATLDSAYGLETVCINLTHTWDDDLVISLVAPDGTEFILSARHGWDGDNYTNTCFNQGATVHISNGYAPFTGTYIPDGSIAMVNNGQNGNGLWRLHILDTYPYADEGDLYDWSITFGPDPATPFPFKSTHLPLVCIDAGGKNIPDDPKIMAGMRIIYNGPGMTNQQTDSANIYSGLVGIELRGNSSQGMPKKSYGFETRFPDSSDRHVSLLGMPSESDWVLLANYSDKTLMRNFFSYYMFSKTGRWAPRMHFCDVVLDKEYQGIYLLGEKIKRDGNRVDILSMSPSDTLFPQLGGGYMFKVDWLKGGDVTWQSDFPAVGASGNLTYILEYPKPEDVQLPQLEYINSYVDSFEYVMNSPQFSDPVNGYRKYIDEASFIDYILLNEFTKNVDGYRLSTFMFKDRGGKIHAGPPWDYDLTWGNADYMDCWSPEGWSYQVQMDYTDQCPFWWQKFFQDSLFVNHMRCRWEDLRQSIYDPNVIKYEIDSIVGLLDTAVNMNFLKWPILGIYVWPNPAPIPSDYPGEIAKLKDWVDQRIAWLDANLPGYCDHSGQVEVPAMDVSIFPNPTTTRFGVRGFVPEGICSATLYAVDGSIIAQNEWDGRTWITIPDGTAEGLYLLQLKDEVKSTIVKVQVTR
jgi:hypothetical protein